MNINGKTTLGFLYKNYDLMHKIFTTAKQTNFFIREEVLKEYCLNANINFDTLKEYRIIREQNSSEYSLPSVYVQFLSHLFNDFSMPLHESVDKYRISIANYYLQLIQEKESNKVNDLINSLIIEIEEFSDIIENRTQQLLKQTQELKSNIAQIEYIEKIRKATYWIDNYIIPLNDILDRQNPHSVHQELRNISNYSSSQQYKDEYRHQIRIQFSKLYLYSENIIHKALKNSAIISKELLPLAQRIKSESQILTGAIAYLKSVKEVELGIMKSEELRKINFFETTRLSHTIYSDSFMQDAKFLWERVEEEENFVLQSTENEIYDDWLFDLETKTRYKNKLIKDLPIDSFFEWCHQTLKEDNKDLEPTTISSDRFFAVSSLLFLEEEFEKDFEIKLDTIFSNHKVDIYLQDRILHFPKVCIKER
jgi:hypothetical protein